MSTPRWSPTAARAKLAQLITPGLLGFYTQLEVTEILAFRMGQEEPLNVFSIFVAEERRTPAQTLDFLNGKRRITLKGLKDWKFGVARYTLPIANISPLIEHLCETGEWKPCGKPLQVAKLTSIPTQFVPPDSTIETPWNRLLKNNFWNGSHILEWCDSQKNTLQPLYDDPRRLQELSNEVQKCVPLGLASLSDRLGNIVIQLPVTVLIAKFKILPNSSDMSIEMAWHPKATPRPLRATCAMEFDGVVSGYISSPIESPKTILPIQSEQGMLRGVIWDDEQNIILAATNPTGFINSISFGLQTLDLEPRTFTMGKGASECRIGLINKPIERTVGEINDAGRWTEQRIYDNEKSRLAAERRFVQYKPRADEQDFYHKKALEDVRKLIQMHGQKGTWLWDPYLDARDILETMFYSPYSNSDLRALTAAIHSSKKRVNKTAFILQQSKTLENARSNLRGLKLEYRVRIGPAGWDFHDRFLIFPQVKHGALVWSLGTSVNSLGHKHHVLQQIDDGQLVMDAFLDLWDQLTASQYLVWKNP